jgi:hypothetical protein
LPQEPAPAPQQPALPLAVEEQPRLDFAPNPPAQAATVEVPAVAPEPVAPAAEPAPPAPPPVEEPPAGPPRKGWWRKTFSL